MAEAAFIERAVWQSRINQQADHPVPTRRGAVIVWIWDLAPSGDSDMDYYLQKPILYKCYAEI